jgi:hypothetical protein
MKNFRVEYFDVKTKQLNTEFLDAEDSNEVKSLWGQKNKNKGGLMAVCETKEFKKMLEKYADVMRC